MDYVCDDGEVGASLLDNLIADEFSSISSYQIIVVSELPWLAVVNSIKMANLKPVAVAIIERRVGDGLLVHIMPLSAGSNEVKNSEYRARLDLIAGFVEQWLHLSPLLRAFIHVAGQKTLPSTLSRSPGHPHFLHSTWLRSGGLSWSPVLSTQM